MRKNLVYLGILIVCIGLIKAGFVFYGPKLTHSPEPIEILYLFLGLVAVFGLLVGVLSWADKSNPNDNDSSQK